MPHGDGATHRGFLMAAAACCALAAASDAGAADGARSRGGLMPTPRKTREELVREWDLNSDGKIDAGEAEVAASRMRRERAELRLNSGIDPVTGLPRDAADDLGAEPDDADADAEVEPVEEPAEGPDPDASPALPGTRVPRPRLPNDVTSSGTTAPGTAARAATARPDDTGSRAAADRARQPLTGGVRAGGLPARAGYGAGLPAVPLNAGLPVPQRANPATPRPAPRGGLLPTPRPAPAPPPRPPASRELYDPY